ncbi:MAG TPA: pitrilysin family protein [Vicinamibacterales bacterium]|nr:pitrilysin family protein [Vicinamibacterales bacterium]
MWSVLARRLGVAAAVALALAVSAAAATQPTIKFTDTTLKNGLRVVISEDHIAPVLSVVVLYNVGSRDERAGRTGFAHLFEHMMFKGSEKVGAGEHFYSVFSNGGTMNGTTNKERTLYYEEVPSNQLDMALFLEADRMRSLAINKENLDNQRQAVQEERRLRLDNQPYGRTYEAVDELAFENPAYKHSVIGSMTDLDAASVDDVASFFKTYYAPNNATIAIVGDVNSALALERIHQYFDTIAAQPAPPAVDAVEPAQTAERRQTLEDPLARLPRLDIGYHIPSSLSTDDDAIDLLTDVLASGRSSRLYEVLVRQKQLALGVSAFAESSRGPRLLRIIVSVPPAKTVADVEAGLYAELERLKAGPIADWEIEKSRNGVRRQFVGALGSSLSRASLLGELTLLYGNPGKINTLYDRVGKLNGADVLRVAKQYLAPENRVVVMTTPKPATASKGDR